MVKHWMVGVLTGVACMVTGGVYGWYRYSKHKKANTVYLTPSGRVMTKEMYDELNNILIEHEQRTK